MAKSQRFLKIASRGLLVLVLGSPIAAALLTLQSQASISQEQNLSPAEITRIENILLDSAPRNISNRTLQELSLSNEELNLLIRYAGELLDSDSGVSGRIYLPGNTLETEVSIPLPTWMMTFYLNLNGEFISTGRELELVSLRAGHLKIPGTLVNRIAQWLEQKYLSDTRSYFEMTELLDSVQDINIAEDRLDLDLLWEPTLLSRIRTQAQQFFITDQDRLRIARQYATLAEIINEIPPATRAIPLTTLFKPLFSAAHAQTQLDRNPVAENRTLLLTLAAYVNQEDIGQWLTPSLVEQLPKPRFIEVRVQRRQDLAQHIVSSAAIAASAGASIAQLLSSTKEAYDARYRSGFSFSDVTANTAGMTIGTLATQSRASAEMMQQRMIQLQSDADFLPPVGSSRDGLSQTDFSARYRDSNSSEYQARLQEIEALVFERPLFQQFQID